MTRRWFLQATASALALLGLGQRPSWSPASPEEALDQAIAGFEVRFTDVMTPMEFFDWIPKVGNPVWLAPDGSEFGEHLNCGHVAEGAVKGSAPNAHKAVADWRRHVMALNVPPGSALYWRVDPEIEHDPACYGGGARIYSRFAIGSPRRRTNAEWVELFYEPASRGQLDTASHTVMAAGNNLVRLA